MSTASLNKLRCTICNKATGTFSCLGCSRDFCIVHAQEHRQALGRQMDEEVIHVHDQLQQNLNELTTHPNRHPLLTDIDEWEKQSIEKVRAAAREARNALSGIMVKHMDRLKITLETLKHELNNARHEDDFFESDIDGWKKKLGNLKDDFKPKTITLQQDGKTSPFVAKICVTEYTSSIDNFEKLLGDAQIVENGQLIVHGDSIGYAVFRSKREYSSGQHRFRFKIESVGCSGWMLFAIVSKEAPIHANSFCIPSTYGWAGSNQVYLNGKHHNTYNGYKSIIQSNEIFELLIDCDKRKIQLKNEARQYIHELDVDIQLSKFPWQIALSIYDANSSLRLLP